MQKILAYFSGNHRLTNLLFVLTLIGGLVSWRSIKKEEMPDFETNYLRISAAYPGATAEDIEKLVIFEIEKRLKGLSGIESITAEASPSRANISVELQNNLLDKQVVLQSIREATLDANLPDRVRETVRFFQFKTSEKAIIDIALTDKKKHLLDFESRLSLQEQAKALENLLVSSPYISSVNRRGFLNEEVQILVDPQKAFQNEISMNQIASTIRSHNLRVPAGSLEDPKETKISIRAELEKVDDFLNLAIVGNFDGPTIRLKDIATVKRTFQKSKSLSKINGREAVVLNVKKSFDADITKAQKDVMRLLTQFKSSRSHDSINVLALDDESYVIRNRINIIATNGIVGFALILGCLFLFLDFRSGIWVAMGIPFSLCFTLIISHYLGFTVNNVTLAAVIIVLGIVVDDAIIVAENVSRQKSLGVPPAQASVQGTNQVLLPIVASILTTCIAFVPFYFFDGRFSSFVKYIPSIVTMMLIGSLLESLFILPSHLQGWRQPKEQKTNHWFFRVEYKFAQFLRQLLKVRWAFIVVFLGILAASVFIFKNSLKFVLFPKDENSELYIRATATESDNIFQTAEMSQKIESMLMEDKNLLVGIRTSIGESRRGRRSLENQISFRIELKSKEERGVSFSTIADKWQKELEKMEDFSKTRVIKSRFGFSSGSAIEIMIQENNDGNRRAIANELKKFLDNHTDINSSDIEQPILEETYEIILKRDLITRLNFQPEQIATTMKSVVEGLVLYTIPSDDEEIEVKLSNPIETRLTIEQLLEKQVGNTTGYLVPLKDLVEIKKTVKPATISRRDFQRTTMVYGDLKDRTQSTSLDIANLMEASLFPEILKSYPTAALTFKGEVEESRSSRTSFTSSILLAVLGIYGILILLFNSFTTPILILFSVPFGMAGVVIAFYLHQKDSFGFFAVVGAIGMSGVVINDSIVLISTYMEKLSWDTKKLLDEVATVTASRLRAVLVTTITTVAGLFPTAYGIGGTDAMLAEMMLAMGWGLLFGTAITLGLVPVLFSYYASIRLYLKGKFS